MELLKFQDFGWECPPDGRSSMLHYPRGLAMPNPYQVCILRFTDNLDTGQPAG